MNTNRTAQIRSIELNVHRILGHGRWASTGLILQQLGRDWNGYEIDFKWASNILNQMVADGRLEVRNKSDADLFGGITVQQYRLPRNVD